MKIRTGFVSNSSTTSFCLIGATFEWDDFDGHELLKSEGVGDIYDVGWEICAKNKGFDCHTDPYNACLFIGVPAQKIKDDQTPGEIKERVKKIFKELGFPEKKVDWIAEGWYSG